jgi:hypothetical protein
VEAWQDWSPVAPDELAASLLLTASSDAEEPPVVNVFGAMLGTESDTEVLLDELVARVGADPTSATLEHAPYRATKRYLAEHGPGEDRPNGHQFNKSEFFRRGLPTEAITALVENLKKGRVPGQSRELDFTPWAGAYNRLSPDATAFAHRDELFLLLHVAAVDHDAPPPPKGRPRGPGWAGRGRASVGLGGRLPELSRPRPDGLGPRLPRDESREARARQEEIRPGGRLRLPPVDP